MQMTKNSADPTPLVVVIPVHNEAAALGPILADLRQCGMPPHTCIVVDDGSSDDSAAIAHSHGVQVIRHADSQGYGAAIKTGIRASNAPYIALIDGDGSYQSNDLVRLWQHAGTHDMVIGARQHEPNKLRGWIKRMLRTYARKTTGLNIPDLNSGLRIVHRPLFEQLLPHLPDRFSLTTTLTLLAHTQHARVVFVPIAYAPRIGRSKFGISDALRMIRTVHRCCTQITRVSSVAAMPSMPTHTTLRGGDHNDLHVVILGAGPAGLGAAQRLCDRGARVTVVEAHSAPGGLSRSLRVGDHWVDIGPHRLHHAAPPAVRAYLAHAPGGLITHARRGAIHTHFPSHVDNAVLPYPLSATATLRALGWRRACRFALSALCAPCNRLRASDQNVSTYAREARQRIGHAVFNTLYAPAAEKVWGRHSDQLDAAQAHARIGVTSPWALVARLFGHGEPGTYQYPAAGHNGAAYHAWAADLAQRGVVFHYNTRIDRITHHNNHVNAVHGVQRPHDPSTQNTPEAVPRHIPTPWVISTAPLPTLCQWLDPQITMAPATQLPFRTVIMLYIVVARPRFMQEDVHYFPHPSVPFARLTEQTAFGRSAEAPADQTVISCDFYDDPQGPWCTASAEQLLTYAWPALHALGLQAHEVVTIAKHRAEHAYPIFDLGFQQHRNAHLDAIASIEGLVSTGRAGLFLHVNQHDAITMGMAAADCLVDHHSGRNASPLGEQWRARARQFEHCKIID